MHLTPAAYQSAEHHHLLIICGFLAVEKNLVSFADACVCPLDDLPLIEPLRVCLQAHAIAILCEDVVSCQVEELPLLIVEVVEDRVGKGSAVAVGRKESH